MSSVVAAIASNPAIVSTIEGLFQGSSYDATHQQILAWAQEVVNNPAGAAAGNYNDNGAGHAWIQLRCWAGDQTVITAVTRAGLFGPGASAATIAQGCGCEVAHGCRADAQTAIAQLQSIVQAAGGPAAVVGALSSAPSQSGSTATGAAVTVTTGGTTTTSVVGSTTVATSTLTTTAILLVGAGLLVLVVLMKRAR